MRLNRKTCSLIVGSAEADHEGKKIDEDDCKNQIEVFENAVEFTLHVKTLDTAALGQRDLNVSIKSQACGGGKCFPVNAVLPTTVTLSNTAVIAPCPVPVKVADTQAPKHESFWAFLLAAALGGAVSLLTPCVFPMIPITVSVFTKRQHISHLRAVRDAFIFSTGIVLTYVGLGFFFALVLGQNIRDFVTNPWTNLAIFTVFVVMACNLFGFFEIQIPTGLVNRLNKKAHGGNSILSLLLMGLVFTMTSFTCTGPFVGTVMIWAVRGEWVWPLIGMIVFATVFSAPFFFLALFPAALKSLPKSGGWMNSVKVVMGFVELAAALKFLSNADLTWYWQAITHEIFVGIWLLLALATVVYLFGYIRFPHDSKLKRVGPLRAAFAFLFLIAAVYLTSDLLGFSNLGYACFVPAAAPVSGKVDRRLGIRSRRRQARRQAGLLRFHRADLRQLPADGRDDVLAQRNPGVDEQVCRRPALPATSKRPKKTSNAARATSETEIDRFGRRFAAVLRHRDAQKARELTALRRRLHHGCCLCSPPS